METWQAILSITGGISTFAIVGAVFWANSKNKYTEQERKNNKDALDSYVAVSTAQAKQIDQLHNEVKELRLLHNESVKENAKLQGQIDAYTRLPLQQISNNQHIITQVQVLMAKHMGIEGVDSLLQELKRNAPQI